MSPPASPSAALSFALMLGSAVMLGAAAVTDFADVVGGNTYFAGSWAEDGSITGSLTPAGALLQGDGVFAIAGASITNDADSFLEMHFADAIDLGGAGAVEVTAQVLTGNQASSFEVRFFDRHGISAFATFAVADFSASSHGAVRRDLFRERGFDGSQVEAMRVSGARLAGGEAFALSFDAISLGGGSFHSADYNADGRLDLIELLRVIELYNTRFGTVRTGAYALSESSEDGFAADPAGNGSGPVALARYHSGDFDRDGRLSLGELLRVIELYNTRSGTVRTGEYRTDSLSADGFAAGPRS